MTLFGAVLLLVFLAVAYYLLERALPAGSPFRVVLQVVAAVVAVIVLYVIFVALGMPPLNRVLGR